MRILQETSCNECEIELPFWIQIQLGTLLLDLFTQRSPKDIDLWLIMSMKK